MNNPFKNSIIKATRPGMIDVWNAFMVEGADFTQKILLTYGSAKYPCFETLREKGIEIKSYPSRTARVFEKGASV